VSEHLAVKVLDCFGTDLATVDVHANATLTRRACVKGL
jgi:hypothetical protein